MLGLVGSRVDCLRVLFLLYELPGIRVGLLIEAYSGAGKTHPHEQVENQKENAI